MSVRWVIVLEQRWNDWAAVVVLQMVVRRPGVSFWTSDSDAERMLPVDGPGVLMRAVTVNSKQ